MGERHINMNARNAYVLSEYSGGGGRERKGFRDKPYLGE
jgi:hypothetical protein